MTNVIYWFDRLLALEDRFHDLEGQQTRKAEFEQQKYAEYIVCWKRGFRSKIVKNEISSRVKKIEHFYKKKKFYKQGKEFLFIDSKVFEQNCIIESKLIYFIDIFIALWGLWVSF